MILSHRRAEEATPNAVEDDIEIGDGTVASSLRTKQFSTELEDTQTGEKRKLKKNNKKNRTNK